MLLAVRIVINGFVILVVGDVLTFLHGGKKSVLCLTHATVYAAVLGHCVSDAEAYHAVVAIAVAGTHQFLGKNLERVTSVEVIGIVTEILLEILSDNENHLPESGADGIINGLVHDGLSVGTETVELFQTTVTASHSAGEYE